MDLTITSFDFRTNVDEDWLAEDVIVLDVAAVVGTTFGGAVIVSVILLTVSAFSVALLIPGFVCISDAVELDTAWTAARTDD